MACPFRSTARSKYAPGHLDDDERAQCILYGSPTPTKDPSLGLIWKPLECDEEREQELLGAS